MTPALGECDIVTKAAGMGKGALDDFPSLLYPFCMDMQSILDLSLAVLRDWRVIAAAAGIILYIALFINITTYQRKKKVPKEKKPPPEKKKKKQKKGKEGEEGDEEETGEDKKESPRNGAKKE
jgi:hypothetical protein